MGASLALALGLAACNDAVLSNSDPALIRNPTVPIGAITRFDAALFDGQWEVVETAGGDWDLRSFTVTDTSAVWQGLEMGALTERAQGILQITYADGRARDIWIVWIDPDHRTAAIGDPDGRFGFVATRPGRARADQIEAARQVLDFNGYRTDTWESVP
ncbi:MAG: hypothetical protein AAF252_12655 [Pseudomonadota bacterium]